MGEAVGDYEPIDLKDQVVTGDLTEDFGADGDFGGLVLYYDAGGAGPVIDDGITAAAHAVKGDGVLIGYMGERKAFIMNQE